MSSTGRLGDLGSRGGPTTTLPGRSACAPTSRPRPYRPSGGRDARRLTGGERRASISHIDIDADLNWVDDDDRNIAKVDGAASRFKAGNVAIAGRPGFWSWLLNDEVDGPWIYFRQVDSREAATYGELVIAAS